MVTLGEYGERPPMARTDVPPRVQASPTNEMPPGYRPVLPPKPVRRKRPFLVHARKLSWRIGRIYAGMVGIAAAVAATYYLGLWCMRGIAWIIQHAPWEVQWASLMGAVAVIIGAWYYFTVEWPE